MRVALIPSTGEKVRQDLSATLGFQHRHMSDSKPSRTRFWTAQIIFGLLIFFAIFTYLESFTVWPPDWIERRGQRQKVLTRVGSVGGWDALRRDCALIAKQNKDVRFQWFGRNGTSFYNTNTLPPAVAALKPNEVNFFPIGSSLGGKEKTTVGVVQIRIFGMHATGGNSTPFYGLEVVCSTNVDADVYKPDLSGGRAVPGNNHSTFKRMTNGIFEIY